MPHAFALDYVQATAAVWNCALSVIAWREAKSTVLLASTRAVIMVAARGNLWQARWQVLYNVNIAWVTIVVLFLAPLATAGGWLEWTQISLGRVWFMFLLGSQFGVLETNRRTRLAILDALRHEQPPDEWLSIAGG